MMNSCMSAAIKQITPAFNFKAGLNMDVPFLGRKDKVVFVMGATGTGKSRLAIDLATRFPAEVINSDKIQVYKGLDIVTNKVTETECRGIPHHLLGFVDPNHNFDSSDFIRHAGNAVESIVEKDRVPIIAGGSNSFIDALVNRSDDFLLRYQCCFLWVDVKLPILNSFVSDRVNRMVAAGLVDEVRGIFDPENTDYSVGIKRAIGVPELDPYLRAEKSRVDRVSQKRLLQQGIVNIKVNTESLVTRQLTKIHRLYNKWGWRMHRVDATEVFLRRSGEAADEAWEKLVARPSAAVVDKFLNQEDRFLTVLMPETEATTAVGMHLAAAALSR